MEKNYRRERILWVVEDPLKRKVILTKEAYSHVKKRHPTEVIFIFSVKEGIKNPLSIWQDIEKSSEVWYYFIEIEEEKRKLMNLENCYIMVVAKKKENIISIATWYKVDEMSKKGAEEIWPIK